MDLAAMAAAGRETEAAELMPQRRYLGGHFPALIESLHLSLQGDHAGSLEIVRRALALQATDPEMRFYLARQLARDGAPEDALTALRALASEGFLCSTALRCDPWLRLLHEVPDFPQVLDEVLRCEAEAKTVFQAAGGDKLLA